MERYKVTFEFTNGNIEDTYFTENPHARVQYWIEREKGDWIPIETGMVNLDNVNMIRIAKVELDEKTEKETFIEWV
ncbi:hypothetical protein [Salisediminibacterium halotolerans]|uniref:Uncharacterized protein n=1 Tax=Salisediminibacterium halotolerans TaxID=517425 RepID=A0A1H9UJK3_9BACI|nr:MULTISPECIES: hypothetical protein [Salisediminibacterium]RLJ71798.1 hypothetical protein BCL39_2471 [Actinophytocola xinjiangensis]RPE86948.1 hypothetical protein EDD67_1812 [Salisediminibacterium halotolerans]TWG33011.1 hypothetical protein BCL52_2466 [Salisediminibacterium halotolerans]SES09374.1 hypothetical protein SAMN05444126_11474 [Salisediminibacterium haloalkalitolerans]GEL08594.1 hypothetical protein SHA02_20100 [Salisediminibacterium halotolerans]